MYQHAAKGPTLNEEDGDVVAHNVPVALVGVELDGETTHITDRVGAAAAALDGGEAQKHGRLARGVRQDVCEGDILGALLETESSKGTRTAGVNNTLRDTLVIEAVDLIAFSQYGES